MSNSARHVAVIPFVLLTMLATGVPQFPALERAMSKVFITPEDESPALAPVPTEPSSQPIPGSPPVLWPAPVPTPAMDLSPAPGPRMDVPLTVLYSSFAVLQVTDLHSTLLALSRGGRERNPIVGHFADDPRGLAALKLGTAFGVLYMTEKVRSHSRTGAILMMAAFNSIYFVIVANNYQTARQAGG